MSRHAYLIMAHNQFNILKKLIVLLDDERNDIYIHIDRKVHNFDQAEFLPLVKRAKIVFIDRMTVKWGTYSMIKCELSLLGKAVQNKYAYYHLLSGADLPIKSQDYIHEFFEINNGKEFIHFDNEKPDFDYYERIRKYHLFSTRSNKLLKLLDYIFLRIQRLIKTDRLRNINVKLYKGSNWFSITNDFARYLLSQEPRIKNLFSFTPCCDELFLHTILMESKYKNCLYYSKFDNNYISCMRCIDWNRGSPYIFRLVDYDFLMNSKFLFARKFDLNIDSEIVGRIYGKIMAERRV